MSKAGPLTRSTSNRANPAEAVVGSYDETAPSLSSSANTRRPPRLGECGRRLRSDEIGLALGSPRQDKLSQLPPDDRDVDVFHVCSSPDNQSNLPGGTGEIRDDSRRIKRKGSKWRSCGSFFGRKDSFARGQEPPPFYQLDQAHNRQEQTEQRVAQVQRRKLRDSYYTNQVQQTKLSESIFREKNNGFLGRNSSRRRGLRRREMGDFKPDMQQSPPTFSAQAAASANIQPSLTNDLQKRGEPRPRPFGPLLQVEIPCVELERYSIMFGDLLDPKTQPTISSQPSLLARRQLHLQDLQDRPFDLEFPTSYGRKIPTSSAVSKSPSFSLFPSAPSLSAGSTVNKPIPIPSPLSRSVMAFNHHLSPHTEQSKSQDQDHVLVIVHNSGDAPEVASLEAMQPNSAAFCRSSNSTQASFFECAKDTGLSPLEADSPTMTAKETILQRSIPACKSSTKKLNLHEHTTYSHQSDDIAAEVSIARQISISCRQRQLITQIVPKIAQQPMQPKLVGNSALRKSHHLNLEDA